MSDDQLDEISIRADGATGAVSDTPMPKRYMTVVYEITDETEWRKTNPLRYAHNGLNAVRVCIDDACERLDEAEAEVERLRETLEFIALDDSEHDSTAYYRAIANQTLRLLTK